MSDEIEIWKDIPNYEGYQVSSLGNVKSLNYSHTGSERILKPSKDKDGYLKVVLFNNSKRNYFKIHQLVAMAFYGHNLRVDSKGLVVDHIDNNRANNRADNIQLITIRHNSSKDQKGRSSEFIGVFFNKKKWFASIWFKKRLIHLGSFDIEIEAANAYQKALKEIEQGLDLNVIYPKKVNSSQYIGISWDKQKRKWIAKYKKKFLGRFDTELESYEAREKYILTLQNG